MQVGLGVGIRAYPFPLRGPKAMDIYDDLFPSVPRAQELTSESLTESLADHAPTPEEAGSSA